MDNIQEYIDVAIEDSQPTCSQNNYIDASSLKASLSTCAFVDTKEVDEGVLRSSELRSIFEYNYRYWIEQTGYMSANNYDNSYFKAIVELGTTVVPFILDRIEKKPDPIVYALDLIFPRVVEYGGYNSLENVCELWTQIFKQRLIVY